jgi:hypothetical protein
MDDPSPPLTSPPAPSASARRVVRVLTLSLLAAMVYGAWAWLANRSHGPDAAARGGLTQALSSAVATALIGTVIEALYALRVDSWGRG